MKDHFFKLNLTKTEKQQWTNETPGDRRGQGFRLKGLLSPNVSCSKLLRRYQLLRSQSTRSICSDFKWGPASGRWIYGPHD